MTFQKLQAGLVACGLVLGLMVGCDRGTSGTADSGTSGTPTTAPGGMKLAFVTNNASDFWKLASNGVHKYEQEANIKVDIKMPPTGTVQEQNGFLETLTSDGYRGIAISVIAPDDQVDEINSAASKTNVICHDSDAPKSKRLLYIGTDNYQAGRELGRQIVKLLPSGGKMAVFVGTFAANNASERLRGIEEEIKGKNIQIIARKEDNKDMVKAQSNVEDVIVSNQDVNLLCGLWSYNGPAIATAIESAGKKGKILAAVFDEEDGTLDGIDKGVVACTVVQKPYQFGYLSAKWLHALATKGPGALADAPANHIVDTGVKVISSGPTNGNAQNVKEFRAELDAMKK